MKAMDINNQIFEAVKIISQRLIDKANFNKTIKGTIVDKEANKEIYKIRNEQSEYWAKNINGNETYKNGDTVYVLVPEGKMGNTKFILGTELRK